MKYKLEWVHKLKSNEKVKCNSEWASAETAVQLGEELERSGKAIDLYFYDEKGTSWILKEMKKLLTEIEEEPQEITVYFDGGFHKETNQAGLGAVIFFQQGKKKYRIRANELFDEMDTNNEAEYAAFYFALNILEDLGVQHQSCEFKGDSQVVLKQLEGEWPCYEENLNRWLDRIEEKIKQLGIYPKYTAIPRNDNKEADKLATQALEGKNIFAKTIIL
ncbi:MULTISPECIES: reverse transcriptase-like protein [Neobacillus]|uniref:Reverse transcriptase-like protein n=1 Tax=Neobacillus rhizophilus TaxID=2833579 RepID=A0A942U9C7_9BACI|nr:MULTISPECIES: reverse transcriptase-like protein [Neobacillus]MBS4215930.1 reverse transcriptase-like protein [Neobacillus rhizophilus]MBU8916173.1 reverse transcriptase-like protein [Bacillus sp. FJAT-29953]